METVTDILRSNAALIEFWRLAVGLSAAFLIALGVTVLILPRLALKFLDGYASSVWLNTVESILRFAAGLAFMGIAPETKLPVVFFAFGAILALTAIPMLFLPGLHKRYGVWSKKIVRRILPFYGVCALLLSAGVILGAFLT